MKPLMQSLITWTSQTRLGETLVFDDRIPVRNGLIWMALWQSCWILHKIDFDMIWCPVCTDMGTGGFTRLLTICIFECPERTSGAAHGSWEDSLSQSLPFTTLPVPPMMSFHDLFTHQLVSNNFIRLNVNDFRMNSNSCMNSFCDAIWRRAFTLFLFTKSDIKATLIPIVGGLPELFWRCWFALSVCSGIISGSRTFSDTSLPRGLLDMASPPTIHHFKSIKLFICYRGRC